MVAAEADMLERVNTAPIRGDNLTVYGLLMLDDEPRPEDLRTAFVATGETNTIGA